MLQMNTALFGVGIFVGALTAAMFCLQLVNLRQSSLFGWLVPDQAHRPGLCVALTVCGLGHNFGPALTKPLLSF